ncbi:alpha/beta fold hydrolase [Chloroflexota bacterium]
MQKIKYGLENPDITYVSHKYNEHLFDTGEAVINYATTGSSDKPAIVLIPGQTESWWGYEEAMDILGKYFQVFALDLRGQGRSSRTPGRYTYDNFGNDVVKFILFVVKRPVVVSGLSSGGVIAAWLSAYAPPGMIRGAHYEDPPMFASEISPAYGPSIRQAGGPRFELYAKYLGDQWSIGDWEGMVNNAMDFLPPRLAQNIPSIIEQPEPPQNLKEYDPEWGKAFVTGTVGVSCDHARMLSQVKCPVLFTQHFSAVDEKTGNLSGATTAQQVDQVERLVKEAGQTFTRLSFPNMGHAMHREDPKQFGKVLVNWIKTLPTEAETRITGIFAVKEPR